MHTTETKIFCFATDAQSKGSIIEQQAVIKHQKMLSKYNHSSRKSQPIRYLVIHDTGNSGVGANAIAHAKYFGGGDRQASAHYFVDEKGSVQVVEDDRASWHCGDGRGKNGITNENSIGIELCINKDGDYHLAFINLAILTAQLMKKYKIPLSRVVRHFDASGKICPRSMSANGWEEWKEFQELLQLYS